MYVQKEFGIKRPTMVDMPSNQTKPNQTTSYSQTIEVKRQWARSVLRKAFIQK